MNARVLADRHGPGVLSRATDSKSDGTPRLKVEVRDDADSAHVVFDGELDLATVGIAEEAIKAARSGSKPLVLDLRKLRFLDSSGLRLILMSAGSSDEGGSRVFVVRGPAQVDRVFELTGAGERLNLVDDPSQI